MPAWKYLSLLLMITLLTQCISPAISHAIHYGGAGDITVYRYVFLVVVINREPRTADIFVDGNITVSLNTSSGLVGVTACFSRRPFTVTAVSSVPSLGFFYNTGTLRVEGHGKNVLLNITMVFPDYVKLYDKKFSVGNLRFIYSDGREINATRSEYSESYVNGTVYSTVVAYAETQFSFAGTGGTVATIPGQPGGMNSPMQSERSTSNTSTSLHINVSNTAFSATDSSPVGGNETGSAGYGGVTNSTVGAGRGERYIGGGHIDVYDAVFSAVTVLVVFSASYIVARFIAGRVR